MPSAEAIKKAFIQIRHAAYEQSKNEKERLQKEETKQRSAHNNPSSLGPRVQV
jgi:hypothetical protein